jgi:hypothetical protein|tara:strand:- start:213 stop:434 length:222 start_codon:yes stop_codon:yes gene_type:complete
MEMRVFDQVYSELKLLQQEDMDDLEIAEQSLMAAMVFTMTNAPSVLNGLCLISNTFNGILSEYTLKDIQMRGE